MPSLSLHDLCNRFVDIYHENFDSVLALLEDLQQAFIEFPETSADNFFNILYKEDRQYENIQLVYNSVIKQLRITQALSSLLVVAYGLPSPSKFHTYT